MKRLMGFFEYCVKELAIDPEAAQAHEHWNYSKIWPLIHSFITTKTMGALTLGISGRIKRKVSLVTHTPCKHTGDVLHHWPPPLPAHFRRKPFGGGSHHVQREHLNIITIFLFLQLNLRPLWKWRECFYSSESILDEWIWWITTIHLGNRASCGFKRP